MKHVTGINNYNETIIYLTTFLLRFKPQLRNVSAISRGFMPQLLATFFTHLLCTFSVQTERKIFFKNINFICTKKLKINKFGSMKYLHIVSLVCRFHKVMTHNDHRM